MAGPLSWLKHFWERAKDWGGETNESPQSGPAPDQLPDDYEQPPDGERPRAFPESQAPVPPPASPSWEHRPEGDQPPASRPPDDRNADVSEQDASSPPAPRADEEEWAPPREPREQQVPEPMDSRSVALDDVPDSGLGDRNEDSERVWAPPATVIEPPRRGDDTADWRDYQNKAREQSLPAQEKALDDPKAARQARVHDRAWEKRQARRRRLGQPEEQRPGPRGPEAADGRSPEETAPREIERAEPSEAETDQQPEAFPEPSDLMPSGQKKPGPIQQWEGPRQLQPPRGPQSGSPAALPEREPTEEVGPLEPSGGIGVQSPLDVMPSGQPVPQLQQPPPGPLSQAGMDGGDREKQEGINDKQAIDIVTFLRKIEQNTLDTKTAVGELKTSIDELVAIIPTLGTMTD